MRSHRRHSLPAESATSGPAQARRPPLWLSALLLLGGLYLAGCGDSQEDSTPSAGSQQPAKVGDPGPVHVHGLGINPKDDALFIATHTGLFRAAVDEDRATRVGDRFQDTMGFAIVGPNRFIGSGHPDGREGLPPFLGLIRSADAGASWQPVSLLGKRDFHVLEAAGSRIYGFGSDFESREEGFLVSDDAGRSWDQRDVPEPLIALAVDPQNRDRIIASGERRLFQSSDAGRSWRPLEGPPGLLAWTDRIVVVDARGTSHSAAGLSQRLRPAGKIGGQPAALDSGERNELYVALHDGKVKRSADGGRSWTLRSRPQR